VMAKNAPPSDSEAKIYYDGHMDEWKTPANVTLRHIQLKTETEAKRVAGLARMKGADWDKLVKKLSLDTLTKANGGALGTATREGGFAGLGPQPALVDSALAYPPGAIAGPWKTDKGWHVIKIENVRQESVRDFDQVRSFIVRQLGQDEMRSLGADHVVGRQRILERQRRGVLSRQQAEDLGFAGHHLGEHPAEPEGLVAEIVTDERVAAVRGVALVEDQVDDGEHSREALAQLSAFGHLVGQGAVADVALGAHEPLRDRRLGHEKGARDLGGRETADQSQGERHAAVGRQARVTAREDQPEPVVGDRLGIAHVGDLVARAERGLVGERLGLGPGPAGATETVDRAAARRREEPGARSIGRAGRGPAVERLLERLLDDLLGQVDVAHDP